MTGQPAGGAWPGARGPGRRARSYALALMLLLVMGDRCLAVEQPQYTVEIAQAPFEVRRYAATVVASVHVEGTREAAVDAGFRILASYIFGANETRRKIDMTAPVTQSRTSMTVSQNPLTVTQSPQPPTAPVGQSEGRAGWDIRFTMPRGFTLKTLPQPRDSRVSLIEVPSRRIAAVTFSGFWSDRNLEEHRARLLEYLRQRAIPVVGAPAYAYYDPPWTPWFWRTNEVLIEVGGQ